MLNFEFHNPVKLIFGENTIPKIGEEINHYGLKKVILLAGGGSIRENGVYDLTVSSLKKEGIEWVECWGVQANPVISKVREVIQVAKESDAEAILAVGGGSVIDSAKAIAGGIYSEDPWELFEKKLPVTKALPVFSILTLSATGSEMNPYSVVTNEKEKKKWNISGPALYPKVSIVDPSAQFSLPWHQTVNGALDSLSHTYELYFAEPGSETTLALGESICRTVISMTDRLQRNEKDYNARANLAWASTLALNGISGAGQGGGDWATHGLEHGVSAINPNVAHGAGLGVIFPAWIEYCKEESPAHFKRWAKNVWNKETAEEGIAAMKNKIREWNGATTLRDLGIKQDQLEEIADNADRFGLRGKVKNLQREDMLNILKLCY